MVTCFDMNYLIFTPYNTVLKQNCAQLFPTTARGAMFHTLCKGLVFNFKFSIGVCREITTHGGATEMKTNDNCQDRWTQSYFSCICNETSAFLAILACLNDGYTSR
jgi:hypothetical protein